MHMVEAFGLLFRNGQPFNGDQFEAGLLNRGKNGSRVAFAYRIRLDDAECALGKENLLGNRVLLQYGLKEKRRPIPDGASRNAGD